MQFQRHGICGDKDTVSFEKVDHLSLSEERSAAIHAQKYLKRIAVCLKICHLPASFGIDQLPFDLEIFAAAQ